MGAYSERHCIFPKMKYLVLLVLVFGFAHGATEGEATPRALNLLETIFPALEEHLGNEFIMNAKAVATTLQNEEGPMATMRAVDKVINVKALVDSVVQTIVALVAPFLQLAIDIMGIVGLVFLIIYLIGGGDVKALLGTARSSSAWIFNMPSLDADMFETMFQTVTDGIAQGIHKWGN